MAENNTKPISYFASRRRWLDAALYTAVTILHSYMRLGDVPTGAGWQLQRRHQQRLLGQSIQLVELNAVPNSRLKRIIGRTQVSVHGNAA